jgi:multicomponent Na+:H+ antiporter subunit D
VSILVLLPVVLPLLAAAAGVLLHGRVRAQRVVSVTACAATLAASVTLLLRVDAEGVAVVQAAGWAAPAGISLVADRFAAIMLVISLIVVLAVLVYALGHLYEHRESLFFHPAYLVLVAGVALSFLTGDLFNLFVAFEVMLTASYVLITLGATSEQVRSGMTYAVISLVTSTLFVAAVAFTYAATGTVNLADLAGKLAALPAGLRSAIGLLFVVVFGVKAAVFPLFFWLPDAYPTAPSPITALFAGLLTKVGVYALIRTQTLLFGGGSSMVLLVIAGLTMVVGVLGAIAQNDIKRILSFHIVSQIGYMVMGLGLFTLAGLAGAIFYIVHHIVVKTALFLVGGMVEHVTGTAALSRLAGMARRAPAVAVLFAIPALSLAGIPPLSGFVAKLALVEAGLAIGQGGIVAVSLLVSLLTVFSMAKIWAGAFWGDPREPAEPVPAELPVPAGGSGPLMPAGGAELRVPGLMLTAAAALALVTLGVSLGAGPLYQLSVRAAADLLNPDLYVQAVLG